MTSVLEVVADDETQFRLVTSSGRTFVLLADTAEVRRGVFL